MFGSDQRRAGEFFLNGGEDLHPFDRIDAEIGIKAHVESEHLHRVAGLLTDDCKEGGSGVYSAGGDSRLRSRSCRHCSSCGKEGGNLAEGLQ